MSSLLLYDVLMPSHTKQAAIDALLGALML